MSSTVAQDGFSVWRLLAALTLGAAAFLQPQRASAGPNCTGYSVTCKSPCSPENEVDACANERPGCYIGTPQCAYDSDLCGVFQPWKRVCIFTGSP